MDGTEAAEWQRRCVLGDPVLFRSSSRPNIAMSASQQNSNSPQPLNCGVAVIVGRTTAFMSSNYHSASSALVNLHYIMWLK